MRFITLIFFITFLIFQTLYVFVPLVSSFKRKLNINQKENGISVLIPAYNEELVLKNCISAVENVEYSNFEVIIINDGSKDGTMDMLEQFLDLKVVERRRQKKLHYNEIKNIYQSMNHKKILVIDKRNGGKADALNAGIDCAGHEIIITLDADSMLDAKSLQYINAAFHREDIIAAGGTVHVVQGTSKKDGKIWPKFPAKRIIRHQALHYIHGFYVKKQTQSVFNSIVVISGAFGAFKRNILFEIDGFRRTVGEDMDITLKIYRYMNENKIKKRLVYVPEAVCYTECPEDLHNFVKQRFRWQNAFIDCVVEYWKALFNEFNTSLSLFFLIDGFFFGTVTAYTSIFMPVVILLTGQGYKLALLLYLCAVGFDIIQSIVALIVSGRYGYRYSFRDYIRIALFAPIDLFVFKQIPLFINTVGTISYFFQEERWNYIERKGEVSI
ncbi:glycosyltransferase family 2 protein [Anaerocolumna xylanovorans]|uniref:Glycosyltransferase, catalytic subunit of cellulose synthase and poly-beta-1,6-N-acetylglucosamine synthase n=1 Tax=Anaerocolumna xylanovorans DSM 12503 TaxID=1121345 RepID=A0A1M7YCA4_9FIRM|nr:glycosyltransferase [Anaerocolumna xylanovorans]SHO50255.1 Glycosyltransferase, catalytic subunit of cellulose synthase and poly-beta-1,6-N-acetylglucosamine synthase [Anaerocolumna xylanovorans DSM 12503]